MSGLGGAAIRAKIPFKSDEKPVEAKSEFGEWTDMGVPFPLGSMIVTVSDICMYIPSEYVEPEYWDYYDWYRELFEPV